MLGPMNRGMRTERTNLLYSRSDLLPIVDGFAAPEIVESAASPTEVMGKGGRALQDEDEVEGEGGMSESRSSWRESGPGRLTHPRGVPNLTTGTFAVSLRLIPVSKARQEMVLLDDYFIVIVLVVKQRFSRSDDPSRLLKVKLLFFDWERGQTCPKCWSNRPRPHGRPLYSLLAEKTFYLHTAQHRI